MRRINFGLLKTGLFNSLTESLNRNDEFTNNDCIDFFNLVKGNAFLQLESIFYKNLLEKEIKEEASAIRYIDENINLFKNFTKQDYLKAHELLSPLHEKVGNFKPYNSELLIAIDNLLYESLEADPLSEKPNIDALHEGYETVLESIKKEKPKNNSEATLNKVKPNLKESILKNAITKFNNKYAHLNESDKSLLKIIINPDNKAKQELFEALKTEASTKLQKSLESASEAVSDRIKLSINKLDKMKFEEKNSTKDIIKIYNLKNKL